MIVSGGYGSRVGDSTSGQTYTGPTGQGPAIQGVARDLTVTLTSDQQSLNLVLTPNDNDGLSASGFNYTIFWLDPAIFSRNDIYGQPGTISAFGIGILQGRKKVADVAGGAGVVSATVPYLPYSSGGWMYAVAMPVSGGREYRLAGTNFVKVPVIGANGQPSSLEFPVDPYVYITNVGGNNRLVQFGWTNAPSLQTVGYVAIYSSNYGGGASLTGYSLVNLFRVTTPGARQGPLTGSVPVNQANGVILEPDIALGAHTISWKFVPWTQALVGVDPAGGSVPFYNTTAIA